MRFKKSDLSVSRQIGFDKAATSIGLNNRKIKRALIKKYSRHFSLEERRILKKMSVEDVNKEIDVRIGKFN